MSKSYELTMKPTFSEEMLGFPSSDQSMLWEKVNHLLEDPLPDGYLKRKVKAYDKIFRLKMGDWRLFYSFGDGWVKLLALRRRDDDTYDQNNQVDYEEPNARPDETSGAQAADFDELAADGSGARDKQWKWQQDWSDTPELEEPEPLPREITAEWLDQLRIPREYFPQLIRCTNEDELLESDVPSNVLNRVVENIFERELDAVLDQPDLVVRDTDDLIRYKEGDLFAFLLKLDPRQEKLVDWAITGPTMVKGGPGTGKSTVALYRVQKLLEQPGNTGKERVLFTTYTRALVAASEQLLEQLLDEEQFERVDILRCDQVARKIAAATGPAPDMPNSGQRYQLLREVLESLELPGDSTLDKKLRKRALEELGLRYLREEFDWIIEGRNLQSLDEYLDASRAGRGIPFGKKLRETVWAFHQAYVEQVESRGKVTWGCMRQRALQAVQAGDWTEKYDYVVVDEAQDLTPVAMSLMAEMAKSPEGIFMASDHKQSIYSKNYAYTSVHPALEFVGRTRHLRQNYRSTEEIEQASFPLLVPEENQNLEMSSCVHSGPLPVLVRAMPGEEEAKWIAKFARKMSRHLRLKLGSTGVLVPTGDIAKDLAEHLRMQGVPAKYFKGEEVRLDAQEVKIVTLHSAKGLEFPTVIVAGLYDGTYPHPDDFDDVEEYEERMRVYRRLLYVAMTRAMRGLMLVAPTNEQNAALKALNTDDWYMQGNA
jgi:superfamily I DNA/RNA helicase/mRNA-degrading endonuclease RelE of RelBE toxin-antitoxin system